MNTTFAFIRADARRIQRDPMMLLLISVPLVLALSARGSSPWLADRLGAWVTTGAMAGIITAVLLLVTPLMFGFVTGLALLDDRDEGILQVVAITPVGRSGFLRRRLLLPVLFTAILGLAILWLGTPASIPAARALPLAGLAALETPLIALFLAAFAGNKVEGMALAKVASVILFAGAVAALLPGPWRLAGAPVPTWWLVTLLVRESASRMSFVIPALAVHVMVPWWLFRTYDRRLP